MSQSREDRNQGSVMRQKSKGHPDPLFYTGAQYTKHMKNSTAFFNRLLPPVTTPRHAHIGRLLAHASWICAVLVCAIAPVHAQTTSIDDWQPGQTTIRKSQDDPHENVRKLLRQEKYDKAQILVKQGLVNNPRDPQMRFWQAFLLEQQGQIDAAKQAYTSLTQEYPELAEPQNNLGVIYASQGDYPNAKACLELALRANPNYAQAHENLGDVLAQMARQSYQRALTLNPKQRSPAQKIELLKPALALTQEKS